MRKSNQEVFCQVLKHADKLKTILLDTSMDTKLSIDNIDIKSFYRLKKNFFPDRN
jgi:hypothetical protein